MITTAQHQRQQKRRLIGKWLLRTLRRVVCPELLYVSPRKYREMAERAKTTHDLYLEAKIEIEALERRLRAEIGSKSMSTNPSASDDDQAGVVVALLNTITDLQAKLVEAERNATTDPLTRLLNRRGLDEKFAAVYGPLTRALRPRHDQEQRRRHQVISALMIDVDHFKVINDQFGHKNGDRVLVGLGALVLAHPGLAKRSGDMICRWGGEEFLIILPQESMIEAYARANTLVSAVRETHLLQGHPVTISIGVTTIQVDGSLSWEEMFRQLYRTADLALYEAKYLGRNRAIPYHPDLEKPKRLV